MRLERIRSLRRAERGIGEMVVHNGVAYDEGFLARLHDASSLAVDLSPELDISGHPAYKPGKALQAVRDVVELRAMDQLDPQDPDLTLLAADMVYANTLQWHTAMAAGLVGDSFPQRQDQAMGTMLLVVPYEHGDLARKLVVSGVLQDNVDVRFGAPHMDVDHDLDANSYAVALDRGYISRKYLRGAQFRR